jgi:hypothetical protein
MNKIDSAVSALKKDFTREEIVKMDKKEIKKFAKTKGFAIGTILLAIALIAAIGAAIAIASKSGSGDAASQTAKLGASNIINQGAGLKTTADKYRINGASFAANQIVLMPLADGSDKGVSSSITAGGFSGVYGVFNPTNGVNFTPLPAAAVTLIPQPDSATCSGTATPATVNNCTTGTATTNAGFGGWYINKMIKSNAGTTSVDNGFVLAKVSDTACAEINKQVNGTMGMTSGNLPKITSITDYTGSIDLTSITAATNATTVNAALTGTAQAAWGGNKDIYSWTEGCISNGGISGDNFYFNIVQAQ